MSSRTHTACVSLAMKPGPRSKYSTSILPKCRKTSNRPRSSSAELSSKARSSRPQRLRVGRRPGETPSPACRARTQSPFRPGRQRFRLAAPAARKAEPSGSPEPRSQHRGSEGDHGHAHGDAEREDNGSMSCHRDRAPAQSSPNYLAQDRAGAVSDRGCKYCLSWCSGHCLLSCRLRAAEAEHRQAHRHC